MFEVPDSKRVKRSDLFRDDDASPVSRGSTRSISPARPLGSEGESIVKPSYGFEYDFVAPNPSAPKPTLASSQSQPVVTSQEEDEDQEFQFRLFTSNPKSAVQPSKPDAPFADPKIRLSRTPEPAELADSLSLEKAHFLRPNRPDSYYFTSAVPEETIASLRSQYADVALSTADVVSRAKSTKWPGSALPWRLIHVQLLGNGHRLKKLAQAAMSTTNTRDTSSQQLKPNSKRPSKKRRILLRRRLALRQELAAQVRATEETEREKRTRRNREKKVKRKEREKKKKLEAPEGKGGPAGAEEGKGEERGEGGEAVLTQERNLGTEEDMKAHSIQGGEIRSEGDSATQAPDLTFTTNSATVAVLSTNASKSSAPTRRAPTSKAPTAVAALAATGNMRAPKSIHSTRPRP
ncbi:uncharacterized protein PV07_05371 [Cladophialophora immunda]|uniref:Uncharacterized protein n=1 Tax=Cladophialophora immunda TaxID=569365 RepID=A0A0D2CEM3_9EURO|nr:uncharacterized protein PV07_05371 [Cladophialophora immunda]KIW29563.1 hypothetical protein PV07_05371 [Cladophialophora immunda]OQV07487.1 hypothetical protein CLAIMM_11913 [Cladophialophora immunda]